MTYTVNNYILTFENVFQTAGPVLDRDLAFFQFDLFILFQQARPVLDLDRKTCSAPGEGGEGGEGEWGGGGGLRGVRERGGGFR